MSGLLANDLKGLFLWTWALFTIEIIWKGRKTAEGMLCCLWPCDGIQLSYYFASDFYSIKSLQLVPLVTESKICCFYTVSEVKDKLSNYAL